uniref:Uncharacterized protein n=1 Tax=Ciona intestinalis TaxID=7719 RepID=H2XRX0_CIOIN
MRLITPSREVSYLSNAFLKSLICAIVNSLN